jgi:DNA modification methylase
MKYLLRKGDCLTLLPTHDRVKCIFADPPDNIGLGYETYADNRPKSDYVLFLHNLVKACVRQADVSWFSFNAKYTFVMGAIFDEIIDELSTKERFLIGKPCVQVFTFGQHNKNDLGNNHRPLWRLMWNSAKLYPDAIKVPSWRQRHGDKRAAEGGRVPGDVLDFQYTPWVKELHDAPTTTTVQMPASSQGISEEAIPPQVWSGDVLDFPRVTGNSKQRCDWHPTQLHEELVERCIKLSTTAGDRVLDPFGGTGTTMRVCKKLDLPCTLFEFDKTYCEKIAEANDLKVLRTAGGAWGSDGKVKTRTARSA